MIPFPSIRAGLVNFGTVAEPLPTGVTGPPFGQGLLDNWPRHQCRLFQVAAVGGYDQLGGSRWFD